MIDSDGIGAHEKAITYVAWGRGRGGVDPPLHLSGSTVKFQLHVKRELTVDMGRGKELLDDHPREDQQSSFSWT